MSVPRRPGLDGSSGAARDRVGTRTRVAVGETPTDPVRVEDNTVGRRDVLSDRSHRLGALKTPDMRGRDAGSAQRPDRRDDLRHSGARVERPIQDSSKTVDGQTPGTQSGQDNVGGVGTVNVNGCHLVILDDRPSIHQRDGAENAAVTASILAAWIANPNNAVDAADLPALATALATLLDQLTGSQTVPSGYLVCRECGKMVRSLAMHAKRTHGLSADAYRVRWDMAPEALMENVAITAARSANAKGQGLGRHHRKQRQ